MSARINFTELKQKITIEQVAATLGAKLKAHGPQLRGVCPICNEGGDRGFVVTPAKGVYYCFGKCKAGGDMLALYSRATGCSVREAAEAIAAKFGDGAEAGTGRAAMAPSTIPPSPSQGKLKPLDYLQPEHELVQALGISAETARAWDAGFASKGIMRGRFAVPIKNLAGELVAYVGVAVSEDQSPRLLFPAGFKPDAVVFNAHAIERCDAVYVARDPLQVLRASEHGVANVVAFLADITIDAVNALAVFMDEKEVSSINLF
jgi:DNA primase